MSSSEVTLPRSDLRSPPPQGGDASGPAEPNPRRLLDSVGVGRRGWFVLVSGGLLAGCGFALKRAPDLSFRSIALTGFAPRSPLADELKQALARQVRVAASPAQVDVVLQALADTRERSVVAQTAAAQVRELQLRVKLQFKAHTPGGRELLPASVLLLARDLSYNETLALAKAQEEAELYREMQSDVVMQVLRRLSAIKV